MKRKKGLFAVVAALAVSSVMAAMAYTSATVSTPGAVVMSSTEDSLLAIEPVAGVGFNDKTARVENGQLKFYPGWSENAPAGWAGLQRGSSYHWNNFVRITNNSFDYVDLRVDNGVTLANPGTHWYISIKDQWGSSTDATLVSDNAGYYTRIDATGNAVPNSGNTNRHWNLAPQESVLISLDVTVDDWTAGVNAPAKDVNLAGLVDSVGISFSSYAISSAVYVPHPGH